MSPDRSSQNHHWYSPAECAALLDAVPHGDTWRAACPAHGGENREALGIAAGRDRYGHPLTLLHCFAHDCAIEEICAAMGIEVRQLFCINADYARATRNVPRARSPRIDRLKRLEEPTPDQIAQILLEEMIVSDSAWIQECQPARTKMWELAQADPHARNALTLALQHASLNAPSFWAALATEREKTQR
jgi:hypothetical protein